MAQVNVFDFSKAPLEQGAFYSSSERNGGDRAASLRRNLIAALEAWLPGVLPGGRWQGGEYRCDSIDGGAGSSLSVARHGVKRGLWQDRATGDRGDVLTLLMRAYNVDFQGALAIGERLLGTEEVARRVAIMPAQQTEVEERDWGPVIERILAECVGIEGTIVEAYLRGRGITVPLDQAHLALHPRLWHAPTKQHYPAMVGAVTDSSGARIGLHRTWLDPLTGGQIGEQPSKMMLGKTQGGAVRLQNPTQGQGVLGVCEGIETGFSAMQLFPNLSVFAALSTSGLRAFQLPPGVTRLYVLADHDPPDKRGIRPGAEAANYLIKRIAEECPHIKTEILFPPNGLKDFNDLHDLS